jgi:hypothetical protein
MPPAHTAARMQMYRMFKILLFKLPFSLPSNVSGTWAGESSANPELMAYLQEER